MTTDAKSHARRFLLIGSLLLLLLDGIKGEEAKMITLVVGSVLVGASGFVLFSDKVISYLENRKYKREKKFRFKYH